VSWEVCAPCRAASSRDRVNTGRAAPRGSRANARVHSIYTRAVCTTGLYRIHRGAEIETSQPQANSGPGAVHLLKKLH
jgi:hypothetical protein